MPKETKESAPVKIKRHKRKTNGGAKVTADRAEDLAIRRENEAEERAANLAQRKEEFKFLCQDFYIQARDEWNWPRQSLAFYGLCIASVLHGRDLPERPEGMIKLEFEDIRVKMAQLRSQRPL